MQIICLSCGHKVDLGDAYDDFAGQVRCVACAALLEVKTEEGSLKAVAMATMVAAAAPVGTCVL